MSFQTVVLESLWSFTIGTLVARFSHPHVQKNLVVFHVSGTGLSEPWAVSCHWFMAPERGTGQKTPARPHSNGTIGCVRNRRRKNNPAVHRNLKVLL